MNKGRKKKKKKDSWCVRDCGHVMAALNGAQMQTLGSTLEFLGHDRKVQHWKDVLLLNVTQGKITDCFFFAMWRRLEAQIYGIQTKSSKETDETAKRKTHQNEKNNLIWRTGLN